MPQISPKYALKMLITRTHRESRGLVVEWVTASASRLQHTTTLLCIHSGGRDMVVPSGDDLDAFTALPGWVFRGKRRTIHSFTLVEVVLLVLVALTAASVGGGCCWGCSCCGGCSGEEGSGSVSTGASVVSCVSKTRS